jgi:hypothetical protein
MLGILFFVLFGFSAFQFYSLIGQKETLLDKPRKSIFSTIYSFFVVVIALIASFFALDYAI